MLTMNFALVKKGHAAQLKFEIPLKKSLPQGTSPASIQVREEARWEDAEQEMGFTSRIIARMRLPAAVEGRFE